MGKDEIRKAIMSMIEGLIPLNTTWCTVVSVTDQMCKVKIDDLEIEDILLGFDKSGVIVYPKPDTDVLVAFIDNSKTNGAVIYVKDTDKIEIMGNVNGGILISQNTADKFNAIEQDLNSIKQAFASWGVVPNDGGAALKAATATWSSQMLTETQATDLENDIIKHGNG